jgi:3-deoxy-7-phosphoheptulonate synthase
MIESNIKSGKQDLAKLGPKNLEYGKSITDACISWTDTIPVLEMLAQSVKDRRNA